MVEEGDELDMEKDLGESDILAVEKEDDVDGIFWD